MTIEAINMNEAKAAYLARKEEAFKDAAVSHIRKRMSLSGDYIGPIVTENGVDYGEIDWDRKSQLVIEELCFKCNLYVRPFMAIDKDARWTVCQKVRHLYVSTAPMRGGVPVDAGYVDTINETLSKYGRAFFNARSLVDSTDTEYSVLEKMFTFGNIFEEADWDVGYQYNVEHPYDSFAQIRLAQ